MPKYRVTSPRGIERVIEAENSDAAIERAWEMDNAQVEYSDKGEALAAAAREETGSPLAIGLGRFLDTSAAGLKQAALETGKRLGLNTDAELKALSEEQADNTAAYKALQQRFPLETSLGEQAPYFGLRGGAVSTALQMAGMEALKYGSPQERASKGVVGAGIGSLSGLFGRGVEKYINPPLTPMQRRSLSEMREMGVKPRLSQVTQSPGVERVEDWAARVPFGAGVMEDFAKANQQAVNRGAAESMGEMPEAGQVSDRVFASAKQNLGRIFDEIKAVGKVNLAGRQVNPIQLDKNVASAADEVLRIQNKLGSRSNPAIVRLAQDAKRLAGLKSRIDGQTYQLLHSDLTDAAYGAFKGGDATTGKAYQGLLRSLDDAADRSLRTAGLGAIADDLKATRPLYANFKLLEKGSVTTAGDASPARIAQALRTSNPDAFKTGGGGQLGEIGRMAEAFPPLRPGSQTFERTLLSDPLSVGLYSIPAVIAANATTRPLLTTVPGLLGGTRTGALLAPATGMATRAGIINMLGRAMQPQLP